MLLLLLLWLLLLWLLLKALLQALHKQLHNKATECESNHGDNPETGRWTGKCGV